MRSPRGQFLAIVKENAPICREHYRLTLTLPAIQCAREVWLLAAGAEKAGAVRLALSDVGPVQVPAAGARGRLRTLFLLDRDSASRLPPQFSRAG